jgi:hypothetical protein
MYLMKHLGLALITFSLGCASTYNYPVDLIHKRYEPTKGGVIALSYVSQSRYPSRVKARDAESVRLMTTFCANEPYRIVSESIGHEVTGHSSAQVGAGTVSSVQKEGYTFLQFECGEKPKK